MRCEAALRPPMEVKAPVGPLGKQPGFRRTGPFLCRCLPEDARPGHGGKGPLAALSRGRAGTKRFAPHFRHFI